MTTPALTGEPTIDAIAQALANGETESQQPDAFGAMVAARYPRLAKTYGYGEN